MTNYLFSFFFLYKRQATGGSIPDLLPRLSNAELNVTQSINNTGNVSSFYGLYDCDLCCVLIDKF